MNDSKNAMNITDNSNISKDTEVSSSFENHSLEIIDLNNNIIDSIVFNLKDIIKDNKILYILLNVKTYLFLWQNLSIYIIDIINVEISIFVWSIISFRYSFNEIGGINDK